MDEQAAKIQERMNAHREAQKRYYLKNREKILTKQKAYDDKHREEINKRQREKKYHLKYSKSMIEIS